MKIPLLLTLGLIGSCACVAAAQKGCDVTPADSTQIVEAVRTMYAAAKTDDLEKFHSITTSDFYAFDNGKIYEGDAIMKMVKQAHATGTVITWSVTQDKVHACGDVAWVSYINEGSVTDATGTKPLAWLESVGLVKEQGAWRIQFLNSARMLPQPMKQP